MTKAGKSAGSQFLELAVIVAIALGLALGIQQFLVKPYRIPSPSMEPTLAIGQRVLVNRLGNTFSEPHVGEIVVFHPPIGADGPLGPRCGAPAPAGAPCIQPTPQRSDVNFIKRVVGAPGDRLRIVRGHVIRNGKPEKDGYIRPCGAGAGDCTYSREFVVPKGHWYMMGDNRGASDDSRFWGSVPRDWIIGGAFATYWPPGRIGLL